MQTKQTVGIGIIGMGWMGMTHARAYRSDFNPGPGVGLGYDDLKTIEAHQFLQAIHTSKQGNPSFREAAAVADAQAAIQTSWEEDRWIST